MSRRSKPSRAGRHALGPLLLTFLAGAATAVLIILLFGRPSTPAPEPVGAAGQADLQARLDGLAALLDAQARWDQIGTSGAPEWRGRISDQTSLVRWNAGVSAALGAAGFEVLSGREELIPRRNRWPLQRLSLEVGVAGEPLAMVVVETVRPPSLPPPF
jgi:hypothetical protein